MGNLARYWENIKTSKDVDTDIRCLLCPHYCILSEGESGKCRSRYNNGGTLFTKTFSEISSIAIDPIEKKPLYHYYPGSKILSIGSNACNLSCKFCQNYHISQYECDTRILSDHQITDIIDENSIQFLAFTYSEPIISIEYIQYLAGILKNKGIKFVMVSNGYINREALKDLSDVIDAWNIDLKAFNNDFYRDICGGSLKTVKDNIEFLSDKSHIEISFLVIPGLNDHQKDTEMMFHYLSELNHKIPLHINKYYPNYQMAIQETPLELLIDLYNQAKKSLDHVYIGNIREKEYKQTLCPNCREVLIERDIFEVINHIISSRCFHCGEDIYGCF